jgi:predicted 3-demethylubiquinone-9 3-methyltransferase (glyoxalase superfamily)
MAQIKAKRIKTFLWFDGQAEDAARFYTSVFADGRIGAITPYPEGGPGKPGSAMTVEFELDGHPFVGLNAGPQFKFNEAVSFAIECETQAELDRYWDKLLAGGGKPIACGWLKDRFGVFWQVMPAGMMQFYSNPETAPRVMQAMMKMVKLDIAKLKEAAK